PPNRGVSWASAAVPPSNRVATARRMSVFFMVEPSVSSCEMSHRPITATGRLDQSTRALAFGLQSTDLGVEEIPQRIAEEVEPEDREHDRGAGVQHEPRRLLDVEPPLREDVAPARNIRWHTHAEKRKRRFGKHRRREHEATLDDHGRQAVRQHVTRKDADMGEAARPAR